MLFHIIFYDLKLIKRLKHMISDIIVIFLCMELSSCNASASLKTAYSGHVLTVCDCHWRFFFSLKSIFLNDMPFLNA